MTRYQFLRLLSGLGLCLTAAAAPAAEPRFMEESGTVVAFDEETGLLTLNGRLGARTFVVTPSTRVVVNNRAGDAGDISAGDQVELTYRLDTREIGRLRIINQTSARARVVSVTNQGVNVRIDGTVVTLQRNAATTFAVGGLRITDPSILTGLLADVRFEPDSLVLLNASGRASRATGRIGAVDATAGVITLKGRRQRQFSTIPDVTVIRNGVDATLASLQPDDRIEVVFTPGRRRDRALLLRARGARVTE
ncbi:MAG: hypothetical protein ACK47B_13980 [Armatimonadota bacterium]